MRPPFVFRLAYLHVNAAPVPARLEVAPATLETRSVKGFSPLVPGVIIAPVRQRAAVSMTVWPGPPRSPPGSPCPFSQVTRARLSRDPPWRLEEAPSLFRSFGSGRVHLPSPQSEVQTRVWGSVFRHF